MMKLWTAATPNGWKVSIMLEELIEHGVALPEVDVVTLDLGAGDQFSEAFTAVNPNQKIPAFEDGDIKLMESGAILQYLGEKYPTTLLPEGPERWECLRWLYWQVANLGPVFGNKLSYTRYLADLPEEQKRHPLERFNNEAQRLLRVLNGQLAHRQYVCGEHFTIADIAIYPWIRGYKWSKIDITLHEAVMAWVARVRERPGVSRGLEYGVPKTEVDQWSEDRKKRYASMGSRIADNSNISAS